eukprot:gene1417-1542_t
MTEPLYFFKIFGILSLKRKQLLREEERTSRRRIAPGIDMADWSLVDPTIESFEIDEPPSDLTAIIVLNMRHGTLSSIFLNFLTIDLLTAIWNEKRNGDWTYHNGSKMINHGYFPKNLIMKFLAIKVRRFGLHHVPLEHEEHGRPLREDITEAIHHFKESFPNEYYDQLSQNFQSIVRQVGEFVAGDEKLFEYKGESGDVRKVPNKPARIGLWFYELTGLL